MARRPHILLTTGEPGGIGPDLLIALSGRDLGCRLTVIGDPDLLRSRGQRLGQALTLREYQPGAGDDCAAGLSVWRTGARANDTCGRVDVGNARYVLETIERGTHACLRHHFDALVTPPVHKGVINDAGIPFSGHTEHIAAITGGSPVMMLAIPGLRVALATTHLPLAEVSRALTRESLETVIRVLVRDLSARFALPRPRVLVLGLNPHAGEGGHLGREEIELIIPLLERLRGEGLDLVGPLPADTAFLPRVLESADVVLAMYHDQGLPVLKHAGFGRAVNITLGLPIIRTSVDHGTALELAGSGSADPGSLEAAIACAVTMATASGGPGA